MLAQARFTPARRTSSVTLARMTVVPSGGHHGEQHPATAVVDHGDALAAPGPADLLVVTARRLVPDDLAVRGVDGDLDVTPAVEGLDERR